MHRRREKSVATARAAAAAAAKTLTARSPPPPLKSSGNSRLQLDASKAGMQAVNKQHAQRVIDEISRGSPFYKREEQRSAERRLKNEATVAKATAYLKRSPAKVRAANLATANQHIRELEATRDLCRTFMHVDMDMFYAAVEEKKDPSLRDVPFAVGSRAMLSTSNYLARQYGVRSGMPGFIGKKLCPALWIVPTDFPAYEAAAADTRAVAARYDPRFVTLGLDDMTLDITGYLKKHPRLTAAAACQQFRREVHAETGLTCSGGIAPTPAFAKIASNKMKPNGQFEVRLTNRAQVLRYVKSIPVRDIPGVGPAQEATLNALGIFTCSDMLSNRELLVFLYTEKRARFYLSMGLGVVRSHVQRILDEDKAQAAVGAAAGADSDTTSNARRKSASSSPTQSTPAPSAATTASLKKHGGAAAAPVDPTTYRRRKSISKATTLWQKLCTRKAFDEKMRELFSSAYAVLDEQERMAARTVCVTYTTADFTTHSLRATLGDKGSETADAAVLLTALERLGAGRQFDELAKIRCLGVGFANLVSNAQRVGDAPAVKVKKRTSYKTKAVECTV